MNRTHATAHANIAVVKYWGKRPDAQDGALNLPAVGSLSLTLDGLRTQTTLVPADRDTFMLDGQPASAKDHARTFAHLDRVWQSAHHREPRPTCAIESRNEFPTAAGLASSASGFAALTLAAAGAFGLELDRTALSSLARLGSGSAARSLWGGFVRLDRGSDPHGLDCLARPRFPADHWDVRLIVVQTTQGAKAIGSTTGMELSRQTSPYYPAWIEQSEGDLDRAEAAIAVRDLETLGKVMEHSCFKMHACMLATQPPLLYWNGTTVEVLQAVWRHRAEGLSGFVTIDAGPHVKLLCEAQDALAWVQCLSKVVGVRAVDAYRPGPDASVEVMA